MSTPSAPPIRSWPPPVRRVVRLAVGVGLLAALFWVASRSPDWPGALGRVARESVYTGHDTTALFYTEIEDWRRFELEVARRLARAPARAAAQSSTTSGR